MKRTRPFNDSPSDHEKRRSNRLSGSSSGRSERDIPVITLDDYELDDEIEEVVEAVAEAPVVLEQGKLYFTPIGGISVPLQPSTIPTLSFKQIISIIQPISSLHLTFMTDFNFFIESFPEPLRSSPITIVIGQNDAEDLDRQSAEYPNITVIPARLPITFGVHHSKLMILEDKNGRIHFVLMSANMVPDDWEFRTQQIYYVYGEKKEEIIEEDERSPFQEDLLHYLSYYGDPLNPWIDLIKKSDFSTVTDRLIYSTPGKFQAEEREKMGHIGLKNLLTEKFPSSQSDDNLTFVSQCSSIGSLGKYPSDWFRGEFLKSLHGGLKPSKPSNSFLIFPCVEDVRTSCIGYLSSKAIPYRKEVHANQKWLQSSMCKWRSREKDRTAAMPHCKTYVKYVNRVPQWQLMTSANLSKAAWGLDKQTEIMIRSWEIGVLITDPSRFSIPFDYPLVPYGSNDEPFTFNSKHLKPDFNNRIIN